jgi:hypothetical protein
MSCRPVQTVYITGMVLDTDNSGQYMRAELYGADPVTHKGINLNSLDRVDIVSGQSLNLSSDGGLTLLDAGGSSLNLETGYGVLESGDIAGNTNTIQVNPTLIEQHSSDGSAHNYGDVQVTPLEIDLKVNNGGGSTDLQITPTGVTINGKAVLTAP